MGTNCDIESNGANKGIRKQSHLGNRSKCTNQVKRSVEALTERGDGTVTPYAWPGGYPIYYVTKDAAALCVACVNKEIKQIVEDTLEDGHTGWEVEGADVNWEDASLYCDNCNKRIESAYAEDEAEEDA